MIFDDLGIERSSDVTPEIVKHVEEILGCRFPESYIKLVNHNDEATPEVGVFSYGSGETGISEFLKFSDDFDAEFGILSYRPEVSGIPPNLIAIARDAGDYLICFDRSKSNAVVLLDRNEERIYEVADTFDEFLASLHD